MKALWLGFSLLMIAQASTALSAGLSAQKIKLSKKQLAVFAKDLEEKGAKLAKASKNESVKKAAAREDLIELAHNLYGVGLISLKQNKAFLAEVEKTKDEELCQSADPKKCGKALGKIFKDFYQQNVAYKEPSCANEFEMASARVCCEGLSKLPYQNFEADKSCKAEGNSCGEHSECCSQLCDGVENGKGTCAPAKSCYKVAKDGEECSQKNPYCDKGLPCRIIDYGSSGIGECLDIGAKCSADLDCCSDKCEQGQCVEKRLCLDCAERGQEPASGKKCCPGLYKNPDGKCVEDIPPPAARFETERSEDEHLLAKIIDFIIPSAHAADCQLNSDGLEREQAREYDQCLKTASEIEDREESQSRIARCNRLKESYRKANSKKSCGERVAESFNDQANRDEYREDYQSSVLANVTKSDVKKCEFNSFKDAWLAKSDSMKNAELALMGFEVVHSGKGEDMIISGPDVEPNGRKYWGKSIFGRAREVAKKLRENRGKLHEQFKEIDKKMTCKCLAVFGPSKMNKADFFAANCGGMGDYVNEDYIQGTEGSDKQKSGDGGKGKRAEMDKGAVGLSYEKLLVEYLDLRREAQTINFADNSQLEEDLNALSAFIENYPWSEVPSVQTRKHHLYYFREYWDSGFYRTFRQFIDIGFTVMSFGTTHALEEMGAHSWYDADTTYNGPGFNFNPFAAYQTMYERNRIDRNVRNQLFGFFIGNPAIEPDVLERRTRSGYCSDRDLGICVEESNDYRRRLQWPYFDNNRIYQAKNPDNRCRLNGLPTSCVKSVYTVNHDFEYNKEMGAIDAWPLLDVPLPVTVSKDAYAAEEVRAGKTYAELLDNSFTNHGLPAIKNTRWSVGGGDIPRRRYNNSMRYKIMNNAGVMKKFAIDQGTWRPESFNDFKEKFITGVMNYALCKNLQEDGCVKHSEDWLGANPKHNLGLGNLFEEPADARDFANYVYEMHMIYPRMAAGERIGYPTKGLYAYYANMASNLRLMGSLALQRIGDIDSLYNLYLSDYEKRKKDYQGLGDVEEGLKSKNAKLSPKVYKELASLDFKNGASVKAFKSKVDEYKKSGKYSGADLKVLEAAASHAIRAREAREKREHYEKTYGKTERGKKKLAAAKRLSKALNSPLEKMSMGSAPNLGSSQPLASHKKKPKKKETELKETNEIGEDIDWSAPSAGSTARSYSPSRESLNAGLADHEAEAIVDAAQRDSSLDEIVPGDTIWRVVSKAYKRNLSRVLVLRSDIRSKEKGPKPAAKEKLKDEEKAELKQLLEAQ